MIYKTSACENWESQTIKEIERKLRHYHVTIFLYNYYLIQQPNEFRKNIFAIRLSGQIRQNFFQNQIKSRDYLPWDIHLESTKECTKLNWQLLSFVLDLLILYTKIQIQNWQLETKPFD